MKTIKLYPHQQKAVDQLKSGSILCGGVGSGKTITSVYYYFYKECKGTKDRTMKKPKDLYVITTAKKRDSLDWEKECAPFGISTDRSCSVANVAVKVDSWNSIGKYKDVKNAFFIFDEQRLIGSGAWVKSFLKIAKHNNWILLSATPGDTWSDYIPVFIANGFYKNRTAFLNEHAVYSRFSKFPKIEKFIGTGKLNKYRKQLIVDMPFERDAKQVHINIPVKFDKDTVKLITKNRWNVFENKPIENISGLCYLLRKVVNSDPSRLKTVVELLKKHDKIIIFYNFNYELDILRTIPQFADVTIAEWNGHNHQDIPKAKKWVYLVQYTSGAEGWNCIETNAMIFYSLNYSYKIMVQSAGRTDRLNTKFKELFYYHLVSTSPIDLAINRSLKTKKDFNARDFKF